MLCRSQESIRPGSLWKALGSIAWVRCWRPPSHYSCSEVCVRIRKVKSRPFTVDVGLRQGCVLSPFFFIVNRRVCSLDDPWSFAASNSLMHSIHRCILRSLQFFIIIIMMATFMRVSSKLVFHKSKCISAIKRILYHAINVYILVFFRVFMFFSFLHVQSLAFCVWEWRRYTIQ